MAQLSRIGVPESVRNKILEADSLKMVAAERAISEGRNVIFVIGTDSKNKDIFMAAVCGLLIRRGFISIAYTTAASMEELPTSNICAVPNICMIPAKLKDRASAWMYKRIHNGGRLILGCSSLTKFKETYGQDIYDYLAPMAVSIRIETPETVIVEY